MTTTLADIPTPLTDGFIFKHNKNHRNAYGASDFIALADFARGLERNLDALCDAMRLLIDEHYSNAACDHAKHSRDCPAVYGSFKDLCNCPTFAAYREAKSALILAQEVNYE